MKLLECKDGDIMKDAHIAKILDETPGKNFKSWL